MRFDAILEHLVEGEAALPLEQERERVKLRSHWMEKSQVVVRERMLQELRESQRRLCASCHCALSVGSGRPLSTVHRACEVILTHIGGGSPQKRL